MANFNAASTAANIALLDSAFTYWISGQPAANSLETSVTTGTLFIESDAAGQGAQGIWTGTGFTYAAPTFATSGGNTVFRSELTGGTATGLTVLDAQNNTVFTLNGFSLALSATPRPTIADLFSGNDSITTGAGNDTIDAGTGNDTVKAGLGDDLIYGTVGSDSLDGGAGTDTVTYFNGTAALNLTLNNTGGGTASIGASSDTLVSIQNVIGTETFGDTISGGAEANLFQGRGGNDSLVGGGGNDTLVGGSGIDTLNGGAGNDWASFAEEYSAVIMDLTAATHTVGGSTESHSGLENIIGGYYNDSLTGNAAANELQGGNGGDTLTGAAGNDTLIGGTGADSLVGGDGADRLDGNADGYYQSIADTLVGGAGNDYYLIEANYYSGVFDQVVESAGQGTDTVELVANYYANYGYALAANVENLIVTNTYYYGTNTTAAGNALDNVITAKNAPYNAYSYYYNSVKLYGDAGNDTLYGSHGGDTLHGGAGNDLMAGGRGNDVYYINSAGDKVQERANYGQDKIVTTLSKTLSGGLANIEDATLLSVGTALNLTGNASNNTLRGNQLDNKLDGQDGSDNLFGGAGNDTLLGGLGNDSLNGGMGNDVITGGDGVDTVDFSNLGVAITVNLATTTGQATGAGNDTITGCENATGGMVNDKLTGTADANTLNGMNGNDTLDGLAGNDYLYGGNGLDTLLGGAGFDYLVGGADNDVLKGGADTDNLMGDAGDDKLFGEAGSDVYSGSTGADIFYFDVKEVAGFDTISDFATGEDRIAIDQSAFGGIGDGDTAIEGGVMKFGAGGFATSAELVIFTHGYSASNTAPLLTDAAAAIGSATSAYAVGDDRLFMLDNGSYGHLYLFHSANANALVEATELQLIGMLTNQPDTVLGDYLFVA